MLRAAINRSERMGTPVEWVLLWDVSQLFTCTPALGFGVLPGVRASQKGLTGLGAFFPAFLQVPPLVHSHFKQSLVGTDHRILEALASLAGGPSHRELYWRRCRSRGSEAGRDVVGLLLTRVTQHHQKLVSTDTDNCFLGTDVPHEEAGHLHQDAVTLGVTVGVVVLLEMVDVEIDAPPLSLRLRFTLARDRIQISAVVAPGERIPDAELEQLGLQLLALSDVDENSVTVLFTGLRIDREKGAVGNGSYFSVAPGQLKFDVPHRAIALQLRHLPGSYLGPDEVTRARALKLLQRFDAKHFEKSRIAVDDLAVQRRDVDSFLQTQRHLTERVGIAQASKTFLFFGLSGGLGTTHITASANGMAVALYGRIKIGDIMASRREQEQGTRPTKRGDGDPGTRSGQPNPEDVPSHSTQHKSGYGGERGAPRTSSDQRESPKKS